MAFLIGGANSAADTGFDVDNSCRLNDTSSTYLHKTPGSTGVEEKFTFSFWMKFNHLASNNQCLLFIEGDNVSDDYVEVAFKPEGVDGAGLDIQYNNGTYSRYVTNRLFRDPSAWYHIVIAVDTTQSTASNRHKIYVNGTQETSLSVETAIPQNDVLQANTSGKKMWLGAHGNGPQNFWDGYMAEVVWIDGTQYAASDFGEFDSDSPTIWKPKDVSGLTFGTNGFYLDFEDSSNLGNDANGGTDLTEVNLAATDQSTDTCTNNFCTINSLDNYHAGNTLSEGNLKIVSAGGGAGWDGSNTGTMGVSAGKWYWELFADTDANVEIYGIKSGVSHTDSNYVTETTALGELGYGIVTTSGNMGYPDGQSESYGSAIDADDKLMFALDMDNLRFYFGVNGTWANSGDPAGNSNGYTISAPPSGFYFPAVSFYVSETIYLNFGSPPTGFTISSGNADDNGYGNFEYDVPAGFYSICTKNLGEFGG